MRFALPLIFILMPILEIAVFIVVGRAIGVLPTIGLILLAMVLGVALLRREGLKTLRLMQAESQAGRVPAREIVHGAMIVIAGILLVIPGFIGDVAGLLLFLPPVRDLVWRAVKGSVVVSTQVSSRSGVRWTAGGRRAPGAAPAQGVVELSRDDFERQPNPDSPWRGPSGETGDGPDAPPRLP